LTLATARCAPPATVPPARSSYCLAVSLRSIVEHRRASIEGHERTHGNAPDAARGDWRDRGEEWR
jgi:hypothetical protein